MIIPSFGENMRLDSHTVLIGVENGTITMENS